MERELAFALEAQSQLSCIGGRTQPSKSPPSKFRQIALGIRASIDRSGNSIDGVHVSRQSKRVKVGVLDADSVNADKSKGDKEVPMAEAAKGEEVPAKAEASKGEEPTAVEVAEGEEEPAAAEAAKGENESAAAKVVEDEEERIRSVEKVYVKRKMRKNKENGSTPKRFTRSALKEEDENVEESGTPSRKKLELKLSKKIGLGRMPTNMRELLESGILEGSRVFYNYNIEGRNLQGLIKGVGILCSCDLCVGTKVISPSQFEMHARKLYRHAIKHIFLENGKSLLELVEICKAAALERPEVALQTVISSLPVKGPSMCAKCKSSIEPSSTGNLLICESCMDKKQVPAEPTVSTCGEVRTPSPVQQASASTSLSIPSDKKSRRGRKRKSSNSVLMPKSAANGTLAQKKVKANMLKRFSRSTSVPRSTKSATRCISSQQKIRAKLTMKNQQLHWSVFEEGGLPDGTELTYVSHGEKLLDGYKLGHGIYCSCCKTEISASQFEAHAGWASRKKPYDYIYISNGVSLHEYAVSLQKSRRCSSVKFNDDVCRICSDGGNLLLCDGCPRSFHQECASELAIPRGKWFCKYCQQAQKLKGETADAVAAGRVTGIDPIEQITQRCIRIAKNPISNDSVACVLCRCHDFSKNVFNERTVIVCDQCEREYHIGCLREHSMADLEALPKGKWFCCVDCEKLHSALQDLLTRQPEVLDDALLSSLREKQKDKEMDSNANCELKFVLLSGKNASRENRSLLAQTVDIFHECFNPIVDATSGRDFIPLMVYGRKLWSQDFAGMLCAILTIESNVVSAGTLRVFGSDIAELPIVATSKCNQGKGYFQLLFTCIERLLVSMKIKRIVLPAADEAMSIWTNKFGFEIISPQQLEDLKLTCTAMMTFKGTSMLQKELSEAQNGVADAGDDGLSKPLVENCVVGDGCVKPLVEDSVAGDDFFKALVESSME